MQKRLFTRGLTLLAIAAVAYNSVYFKKLDEVKASRSSGRFDPAAYARTFWKDRLIPNLDKAVEVNKLVALLQTDKEGAFKAYSHALGIGNIRYLLVKGMGEITAVSGNQVTVLATAGSARQPVQIETEYIFGNAVRDALGLIDINEFKNTMDFNNLSAEINKKIRTEVLPPFKATARKGASVQFTGALELNKEHLNLQKLEVIPVALK